MLTATAWLPNQTPMCNKKASAYLRRLTDAKKLKTPFYDKLTKTMSRLSLPSCDDKTLFPLSS